jgi:UDP-glucuronate decarboxylase
MNILLTGGTGFFGKSLLRYWCKNADSGQFVPTVCVMSRSPEQFLRSNPDFGSHQWLSFRAGNVLNPSSLPVGPFTHVMHAAADSTLGPQLSPLERYNQIVDGTRNMLEYAVSNRVERFLFTSSGGVYGAQPVDMERVPETYLGMPDPLHSHNAYSVAKRSAEHLCTLFHDHYGLQTIIARCFAFVGQDLPLNVHFAIGNFIRDALTQPEITIGGDGTPIRSYMDQRDLAIWLNKLLVFGHAGQAYNVGSDQAITIKDLANLVRDTLVPNKRINILGQKSPQNFRNRYVPSIQKASAELGLSLSYSLEESVLETARFAKVFLKHA